MKNIRVVVIEHSRRRYEVVCRDAEIAVVAVNEWLLKQSHRSINEREEIKVRYETMTQQEFDSLEEGDRC